MLVQESPIVSVLTTTLKVNSNSSMYWSALHLASKESRSSLVPLLFKYNASIDEKDAQGHVGVLGAFILSSRLLLEPLDRTPCLTLG